MSISKYAKITLTLKVEHITPECDNKPNTSSLLGQKYEEKNKTLSNIQALKLLPFYQTVETLESIYESINYLCNIYEHKNIIILNALNPWDNSMDKNGIWLHKTYHQKQNSVCKTFKNMTSHFNYAFLFPEISEDGRFHFHGIIFLEYSTNKHFILETLNKVYSNKPNSNKNTYAVKFDKYTKSFLSSIEDDITLKNHTSGLSYITKDHSYMKLFKYNPIILQGMSSQRKYNSNKIIKKPIEINISDLDKIII